MSLAERYHSLNRSFGSPFVFPLTDRGFYSEVNTLLNAAVYGLIKRRRLIVDQTSFGGYRWSDFFSSEIPLDEECDIDSFAPEWVLTSASSSNFSAIRKYMRRRHRWRIPVILPKLGIYGDIHNATRAIASILATPKRSLVIPETLGAQFAAFHIRRGDKVEGYIDDQGKRIVEGENTSVEEYLGLLRAKSPEISSVFVMTDDYSVVEELRHIASGIRFVTFSQPSENGYRQHEFGVRTPEDRREEIYRLVAEAQIAAASSIFIGGLKSNVAHYVNTVHSNPARCFSIDDLKRWRPI